MTPPASAATTSNAQSALVASLNALLADCFALYIKTKNFHWHVKGPNFNDLHLLFDAQASEIFALTDLIAERVRKNGAVTLTSIGAIAERARIADQDDATLSAEAMIAELRADNTRLIAALREAKAAAATAGDNATDGVIDDWTDQAERRVWFLAAILG
jgi:starvation-inducible DNA-binding protein